MTLRTKAYSFLGLIALVGAGTALWKYKDRWPLGGLAAASTGATKQEDKQKEAVPVELAQVKLGPISSYIGATANLRALREVAVATQAEGVVQSVLAEEGDSVEEGQLLCQLDDRQLRIRLELAKEKLAQANLQMEKAGIKEAKTSAQIGHAQTELTRYEKAFKEGLVSDKEAANYRYKLEELQHDQKVSSSETKELEHRVAELQAEIAQNNLEISRARILAPFSGQITQRMVNTGARVRTLEALFNIAAFSPLQADVHLSERDTRMVRPNQTAVVHLGSDESITVNGKVERISPVVDQASGTVKVTVSLANAPGFRPGSFVRVDILSDTKSGALLIPKRAVLEEDGQSYVFVVTGDSAKRTKIELGYTNEGMVEVRSGLQSGQKIVVAGQGGIKEGSKIKVIQG